MIAHFLVGHAVDEILSFGEAGGRDAPMFRVMQLHAMSHQLVELCGD